MNLEMQNKLNNLTTLYDRVKKQYRMEYTYTNLYASLLYTMKNKTFVKEEIEETKKYIKSKTGFFSSYGGATLQLLSILLSTYDNPRETFDKLQACETTLLEAGFKKGSYLPMTAYGLMQSKNHVGQGDVQAKEAHRIYRIMKDNHPLITSRDDYPLAVLLADLKEDGVRHIDRIEKAYETLNEQGLPKGNGLQLLSHILALSNEDLRTQCKRCYDTYLRLKDNKLKLGTQYYASLGLVTLISEKKPEIIDDLIEASKFLKAQYRFLEKGMCISLASALVCDAYMDDSQDELLKTSLSITMEALIAAQVAAMMTVLIASTVVVTTAN